MRTSHCLQTSKVEAATQVGPALRASTSTPKPNPVNDSDTRHRLYNKILWECVLLVVCAPPWWSSSFETRESDPSVGSANGDQQRRSKPRLSALIDENFAGLYKVSILQNIMILCFTSSSKTSGSRIRNRLDRKVRTLNPPPSKRHDNGTQLTTPHRWTTWSDTSCCPLSLPRCIA